MKNKNQFQHNNIMINNKLLHRAELDTTFNIALMLTTSLIKRVVQFNHNKRCN